MSEPKPQDEAHQGGPLRNFALLVLWLCVPALAIGGALAIVSDLGDWDLATGIGGSDINIPKDRYAGLMRIVLTAMLSTGLHFEGDVATLELLLAHGVHPDATREDGMPAMSLACSFGGQEAVAALQAAGFEVSCPRPPG